MDKKQSAISIIILVVLGCASMAIIDGILSPTYGIKSTIKVVVFLLLPIFYVKISGKASLKPLFKIHKKTLFQLLLFSIFVYLLILLGYFFIEPYFDFSNVTISLSSRIGVNSNNFTFVALYISFVNSLLEEFFFRGFAFLCLLKVMRRKAVYLFSSIAFAIYHIAIMANWFSPMLFIALIISLIGAGMLFNWLDERTESIYPSWLIHMSANFAINTIGFLLFDIL